jgi:ATP-dependent DNA helicase PIF1
MSSPGVVVDFMTLADAKQEGIYLPPRAALYSHPPSSVWPIVKFAYSKHAQGQQYDRAIVPGMSVDVMNAKHKPEATRDQVPLILAWVSRSKMAHLYHN